MIGTNGSQRNPEAAWQDDDDNEIYRAMCHRNVYCFILIWLQRSLDQTPCDFFPLELCEEVALCPPHALLSSNLILLNIKLVKFHLLRLCSYWGIYCRIRRLHFCREVRHPTNECPWYDTKLHLMLKLKFWSFGVCEIPFQCQYSQVHSDLDW